MDEQQIVDYINFLNANTNLDPQGTQRANLESLLVDATSPSNQAVFGASGTSVNDLGNLGGTLGQAKQLVEQFSPAVEPVNPAMLSLLYFSKLAEESSKPGSTLLGAAGAAAQSPAAYLLQRKQQEQQAKRNQLSSTIQLANLLSKDDQFVKDLYLKEDVTLPNGLTYKKGFIPNLKLTEYRKIIAINPNAFQPKPEKETPKDVFLIEDVKNTDGTVIFRAGKQFLTPTQIQEATSLGAKFGKEPDTSTKMVRLKESVTVDGKTYPAGINYLTEQEIAKVGSGGGQFDEKPEKVIEKQAEDKKEFQKQVAKSAAEEFAEFTKQSSAADGYLITVDSLINQLANKDFETGAWQQFTLPFKNLFISFLGEEAGGEKWEGVLTDVTNAQEFLAQVAKFTLDSVAKMKGALSDKELGFLQSMQASLGNTKQGNQFLLITQKFALHRAKGFNDHVSTWIEENGDIATTSDYRRMMKDWRNSEVMQMTFKDYIEDEVTRYTKSFEARNKAKLDTLDPEEREAILKEEIRRRYPIERFKEIFKSPAYSDIYLGRKKLDEEDEND